MGSRWSPAVAAQADAAGWWAVKCGLAVITGGLSGVMAAAADGAVRAGGLTIGVLPGRDHREASKGHRFVLTTGIGLARNAIIASACDCMLALPGGGGTYTEMVYALDFGRPVCSWGSHRLDGAIWIPADDIDAVAIWLKDQVNQLRALA